MRIIQYSIGNPINVSRSRHMGVDKIYVVKDAKIHEDAEIPILKAPVKTGKYNCTLKKMISYIAKMNRSDDLLIANSEVYIPSLRNMYLGSTISMISIPYFDDIIHPIYVPRDSIPEFLYALSQYKCRERLDRYIAEKFKPVPIVLPPIAVVRNILRISGIDVILW